METPRAGSHVLLATQKIREYLTYKEWKPLLKTRVYILVSTLPIRNGNGKNNLHSHQSLLREYLTYKEWKPLCWVRLAIFFILSEYLTYKEWKLFCFRNRLKIITSISEYLTYKEWKHNDHDKKQRYRLCEYLTYKEWKPSLEYS